LPFASRPASSEVSSIDSTRLASTCALCASRQQADGTARPVDQGGAAEGNAGVEKTLTIYRAFDILDILDEVVTRGS